MNSQSLELLEYEALRSLVGRYIGSDLGRRHLEAMEPGTDRAALEEELSLTGEALGYWGETSRGKASKEGPARLQFGGLPDPGAAAAKLRIEGSVLDGVEIGALLAVLERAWDVRQALTGMGGTYPRLAGLAGQVGDLRGVVRDFAGKILPDGSLSDEASVALARIRRDIVRQRGMIQDSLARFVRSFRDEGILQDEFVTIRNERFVVPVVPGAKKKVPGVIHGASGSGHTLFVEPLETIELNNDLVRLTEEELREVHRILREMTAKLREHAFEIGSAAAVLGRLDFVFAKARFGWEFEGLIPRVSPEEQPHIHLKSARHPLLEDVLRRQRKRVVPTSLDLTPVQRTLLISGPNTGGKTVAMKTVGLLALMTQSGLPVPAAEAEFPIFYDVLADIGDQQSIEQSLSSFSSHVARIKEMVEAASGLSLVLLDELGRATDPEEGGALGVAILEEFRRRGVFTLASTHLLALKVYGAGTEGVLNASMGFDEETLGPTYVLRTGMPGKSAGLEIASRLGLPQWLIERARAAMGSHERDLQRLLTSLEEQLGKATAEREKLEAETARVAERERDMEERLRKKEEQRLREVERRAEAALERFDAEAKETIATALERGQDRKQAEKSLRQVARTKRELKETLERIPEGKGGGGGGFGEVLDVAEGMRVRLKDVSSPATVRKINADGTLEVDLGLLKMQVRREDVTEILAAPQGGDGGRLPAGVTFSQAGPRWDTLSREVNVIGKKADEAMDEVERFLDTALMAEVTRVRIVHGHGQGILRKAVQQLLGKHPAVEKYYPASPQEGGTGATVVELKAD